MGFDPTDLCLAKILIGNTLHLGQIWGADESSGVLTETGQKNCPVDVSIDIQSGKSTLSQLTYPEELVGENITQMSVRRVLGYKNSFVYNFALLKNLFITSNHKDFNKVSIESNYGLILSELNKADIKKSIYENVSHDEIVDLLYDEFREHYYVLIRKRNENLGRNNAINTEFLYPDCFILILDKNLKYEGEVFFPDSIYSFKMVFITPEGIYISEDHVKNPSFSEDYMRFKLFKLEKL